MININHYQQRFPAIISHISCLFFYFPGNRTCTQISIDPVSGDTQKMTDYGSDVADPMVAYYLDRVFRTLVTSRFVLTSASVPFAT